MMLLWWLFAVCTSVAVFVAIRASSNDTVICKYCLRSFRAGGLPVHHARTMCHLLGERRPRGRSDSPSPAPSDHLTPQLQGTAATPMSPDHHVVTIGAQPTPLTPIPEIPAASYIDPNAGDSPPYNHTPNGPAFVSAGSASAQWTAEIESMLVSAFSGGRAGELAGADNVRRADVASSRGFSVTDSIHSITGTRLQELLNIFKGAHRNFSYIPSVLSATRMIASAMLGCATWEEYNISDTLNFDRILGDRAKSVPPVVLMLKPDVVAAVQDLLSRHAAVIKPGKVFVQVTLGMGTCTCHPMQPD